MYDMYPALVPVFSASAQAFSSASLRAFSLSATMRWLASETCAPEPKFCRYAVYAATVPVFSASAHAFSSASFCACSSAACCCAAGGCESEDWPQAERSAAPAKTPTIVACRNRPHRLGLTRGAKSSIMAGLFPGLHAQRPRVPPVHAIEDCHCAATATLLWVCSLVEPASKPVQM